MLVTLNNSDSSIELSNIFIKYSNVMKDMLEEFEEDEYPILPLSNGYINEEILVFTQKILEHIEKEYPEYDEETMSTSEKKDFENFIFKELDSISRQYILDLIHTLHYLDIPILEKKTSKYIANLFLECETDEDMEKVFEGCVKK